MNANLLKIVADINQALEPHGLIVTARDLMTAEKQPSGMDSENRPNPHPDAHPDDLSGYPEAHPEYNPDDQGRVARLARKRAALAAVVERARAGL